MTNADSAPVALVVGHQTALGRAVSDGLSELGYSLVVVDGRPESSKEASAERDGSVRAIVKRGGLAVVGRHDTATWSGAEAAVSQVTHTFGAIDTAVLIGELAPERAFLRIEPKLWSVLVGRHLATLFFVSQAAVGWMVSNRRVGRIIAITGFDGAVTRAFGRVHLSTVMGGVFSFIRAAAVELRPKGITVNALAASLVSSSDDSVDGGPAGPRYAAHDIMPLIEFLVSEKATEITGQVIGIDGRKLSVLRPVASAGALPEGQHWTPEEIGRRWVELSR